MFNLVLRPAYLAASFHPVCWRVAAELGGVPLSQQVSCPVSLRIQFSFWEGGEVEALLEPGEAWLVILQGLALRVVWGAGDAHVDPALHSDPAAGPSPLLRSSRNLEIHYIGKVQTVIKA